MRRSKIKITTHLVLLGLLIATLSLVIAAQVSDSGTWVRIESPTKDISFALPESGYLVDNEDRMYRVYYSDKGSSLSVTINKQRDAKDDFRRNLHASSGLRDLKLFESGDFLVSQYIPPQKDDRFFASFEIASSKGSCRISVSGDESSGPLYLRFLNSIRLDDIPLFKNTSSVLPEARTFQLSSLKTDDVVLTAL